MKIILLITLSLILDSCLNNGGTENLPPLSGSYSRHDSAVSYCSKTVNSVHYDTTEAIAFDLDLTFADSNKFSFKHYYNGVKSCEGKGHYTGRTIPSNTPIVITYRTISFDDASYDLTFTFTQFSCASHYQPRHRLHSYLIIFHFIFICMIVCCDYNSLSF